MAQVWVIAGPGSKLEIDILQKCDILGVVATHDLPGLLIAVHTTEPKMFPGMRKLTTDPKILAKVVKFIGIELEEAAGNL